MLFAMLYGHLPFEDQAAAMAGQQTGRRRSTVNVYQLYQYISKHSVVFPTHTQLSSQATDLLRGMLRTNPMQRLRLTDIFRHAWFANASAPRGLR